MTRFSRHSLTLLVLLALGASQALSQGLRGDPAEIENRMAAQVDAIVERLALSEAQEAPVRAILSEANEKRMELRKVAALNGDFRAIREQMGSIIQDTNAKLAEVLTENQMANYTTFMEESRNRRRRQ